jgi:hypothetical protein
MPRFNLAFLILLAGMLCRADALAGNHAGKFVDLELVIAVDVSRSVDETEGRLQRQGYVTAFRDAEVHNAIRSGMLRRIAVAYVEWAGLWHREIVSDWFVIKDKASAEKFADILNQGFPSSATRTAISGGIDFGVAWLEKNSYEGTRRVIDVSGDGPNNGGTLVTIARDKAVAAGITVNGLPILDDGGGFYTRYNIPDLDLYYRDCVIGGPGSFIEVAANFKDFARAIRRKLILEIASRKPARRAKFIPAQARTRARASPPCDIGERISRFPDDF